MNTNQWNSTSKILPDKNGVEIELLMSDFTPRDGVVSIIENISPFLIKENDQTYWRATGFLPLYWRYKTQES